MTKEEIDLAAEQAWRDLQKAEKAMYATIQGQEYFKLRELWCDLYDLQNKETV